jgi:aconitate hydratase
MPAPVPPIADLVRAARKTISTPLGRRQVADLTALRPLGPVDSLPYCIKVLLESCLRNHDGRVVTDEHIKALVNYDATKASESEIPFTPGRVVLQDFTGVPCVVDLAAMRGAMQRLGGDPRKVNPLVPCDLVIDHSVQVDAFASGVALTVNSRKEFERNNERYEFLKWGQQALRNFSVVPPATGIVHQVNIEYLAKVVWETNGSLHPDSLVGTDSHTTMVNGLGVVGWGVGGIEAEAVMLGQPIYMLIPQVVGFELTGKLPEGATATDLVLVVTQMLRRHGVVEKMVEFFGPGMRHMPVAHRATIGNMAPEYGATIGFFPVDEQTLTYLRLTGRDEKLISTVEHYCTLQGLWREDGRQIAYSSTLELDLGTVQPSLAGPKRPQDRIELKDMKRQWHHDINVTYSKPSPHNGEELSRFTSEGGDSASITAGSPGAIAVAEAPVAAAVADPGHRGVKVSMEGKSFELRHGSVVIAAITSCTNTSNPSVMVAAGLVARKARERGLTRKPWVKTSLAPGSKVVTEYLDAAGLTKDLDACGFNLVGYGCTTCIGNSGPIADEISQAINEHDLVAASVLSGNRNFEGRIHPDCKANYLASPPLVVAYALAGTVNIDLTKDCIGTGTGGKPVHLRDIWPTQAEIDETIARCVTRDQFIQQYANVFDGSDEWKAIKTSGGDMYQWDPKSTYIQEPPFFTTMTLEVKPIAPIRAARCLVKVGDSVTTDHISPAGSIKKDSPAGKYLIEHGVPVSLFNSYGARRGNDRVMTRGTFANIRVRNQLAPGSEGGWTTDFTDGKVKPIHDASVNYIAKGIPLVILAGKDYGMGSSRDWAAKGVFLLGVKAAIAESFERIHRSNLVGMGVLPLTFRKGESAASLGLDGTETFDIDVPADLKPRQEIAVTATKLPSPSGRGAGGEGGSKKITFTTVCRVDTPVEVDYYRNGGILHTVLRKMARA